MNIIRLVSRTLLAMIICGMAACGGGDGGNSSPVTSVVISPTNLNVEADASVSQTPTTSINLTVTNMPDAGLYIGYAHTSNAITSIAFQQTGDTTGVWVVSLADPAVIGPGTYSDTISLAVCRDDQCVQQVSGSPQTVSLQYVVTGVQAVMPAMTLSTHSVSVQSLPFGYGATANLDVFFANVAASSISVNPTYSSNGISSANYYTTGTTQGTVNIYFKNPSSLGVGVYNDTLTLTASCWNCPRGVVGATQTVTVQYTISSTVDGPNGYTIRVIDAQVNDLIWNEALDRIYLSIPSSASTNGNYVAALNPISGTIEASAFAGSEPGVLAASDDGQYLYVGLQGSNTIRRMQLPGLTQDILIPLGSDPNSGSFAANDIQVAPGQPGTIAVARKFLNQYNASGVVIFDGVTARSDIVGGVNQQPAINWVEWGSNASVLYGTTTENTSFAVSMMDVDGNGAHLLSTQTGVGTAFNFGRPHYDAGLLYTDAGQAFDPNSNIVLGTYSDPLTYWARASLPDSNLGKFFSIGSSSEGSRLTSFDLATFAPISTISLQGLSIDSNTKTRLLRWGADGLAFAVNGNKIVLVNGPFVNQ